MQKPWPPVRPLAPSCDSTPAAGFWCASSPTTPTRFASRPPRLWFVEVGPAKARISRHSVQFFLDWLGEAPRRVPLKLDDPAKLREVLRYHDDAETFWHQLLSQANAE